jgi:basic membrane protein A
MRRRLISLALVAALHGGCARREPPPAPVRDTRFDVALVTGGSILDGGWNSAAYAGIKRIQQDLGAAAVHREAGAPAARHRALRELGAARLNVVFAQGREFQEAAVAAGRRFRGTVYIVSSGDLLAPNIAPLTFRIDEAAFLLGMAAGFQSKAGKGGAVANAPSAESEAAFAAFRAGAQSVRPGFVLEEALTGDARSSRAAHAAAIALIDGGADVVLQMAGEGGVGVIAACAERGAVCFAAPRNLNDRAPEAMLASAVVDVPAAMAEIASVVRGGRFTPRVFSYGMKEGIVTIAWNEELRRHIAPEAMKRIDETQAAILEGTLIVDR